MCCAPAALHPGQATHVSKQQVGSPEVAPSSLEQLAEVHSPRAHLKRSNTSVQQGAGVLQQIACLVPPSPAPHLRVELCGLGPLLPVAVVCPDLVPGSHQCDIIPATLPQQLLHLEPVPQPAAPQVRAPRQSACAHPLLSPLQLPSPTAPPNSSCQLFLDDGLASGPNPAP